MKAAALFICLVGSAFAIPSHPLNYKLGTHGQKTPEKAEDTHLEASKEETTGYADNGDLLPSLKNLNPEVSVPDAEDMGEPQTTRKQGSEHQVKNSLKSISFLVTHNKPDLTSNNQDSDSGSSSREQSSSEHYQFSRQEKHSNTAKLHVLGNAKNPVDALSLDREHNTRKYNKNTVGLSEKNSESDEEEHVEEEEEEEWGEETNYRDTNYKGYQINRDNQYKIKQNENSMQSDESLRDSSQPIQIAKRHGEKFDLEEEERKNSQKKPFKEEILSQKPRNEDQDDNWQSQERKDNTQVNYQRDHNTVAKKQDIEDDNDDDGHDSGDVDSEEYLSNTWKEAAYEEEERIQSNDQESTSTEHEVEETTKDDTAVHRETEDYKDVKIKDLIYTEQDDYDHEPPNSDSNQQLETTSSVQSMYSMESEDETKEDAAPRSPIYPSASRWPVDYQEFTTTSAYVPVTAQVKSTGGSYGKMESASSRSEKASLDPCRNFHCKRGNVCHVDKQGKPSCICQDPAACPSTKDYEHVCGTDNKTYDSTCQLFGTKCQLEGTKIGRQLHLDYLGSCKHIPHCTDYEVDQFPLRMRDWLKNILMQYYERDLDTSGFLTEKQRNKVKKIYENDKRLIAGNHAVELLLHDFDKNYHMYVYPVHWQFHQLDQHPVDRLLTHSELAPLRASLVPMEHCITRFFQECDGDRDKLIALKEWCHCFGIKEEDINENLLF